MKRTQPKRGRRVSCTGKVYYFYPKKKKAGRKHKRGPKKKKPAPKPRVYLPWDYIIVRTAENKQDKYIGRFHTIQDAYAKKEELIAENEKVVFPRQKVNNGRNSSEIYDAKTEYLILKKNTGDEEPAKLRNEYGTLVDHTVTSDKWIICDKFPCLIEEKFWVYGYDNRKDRKTFEWIYNNLIINEITQNDNTVMVYLYNNKVILKYDDDDFNFVICKCPSDAIRMYNLIEERTKKIKQVFMTGSAYGYEKRGRDTLEMIVKKTGLSKRKFFDRSTRH